MLCLKQSSDDPRVLLQPHSVHDISWLLLELFIIGYHGDFFNKIILNIQNTVTKPTLSGC